MKRINKAVLIAVSIFMMVSGMTIKADENIKTITSWSFSDESLIKEDNALYLHVEESSLEDIDTILPKTITAEFSDEEENISGEETTDDEIGSSDNTVNITWNSADIDPSLDSQELYASLPPNYVLANSEEKIALTLIIDKDDPDIEEETDTMIDDETETVIEEEPITNDSTDFDHLIIDEPKPSGTVINLFDYWYRSTNQETDKINITKEEATTGINKDHYLKFGNQLGQADAYDWTRPASPEDIADSSINSWTKSARPHTGIVNNRLDNGYPILIEGKNANLGENISGSYQIDDAITTKESLAYLFSPNIPHDGKEIHRDAKGLLTIDDNGYYHFDSKNTYAEFDSITDSFTLYDTSDKKGSKNCQFFPFNDIDDLFDIENGTLKIGENIIFQGETYFNHFFGMTMTTKFIQPKNGKSYKGEPITYNFSGDDDVWIFIDDVLVADLGGVHDASSVEINFETGDVTVYNDADQNNKYDENKTNTYSKNNLKTIFENAGSDTNNFSENTFAENTYHTLKFFYLERGGNESNLSLRFNLIPVPESEITKVDQEGNPIAGVGFELYGTHQDYTIDSSSKLIWTGVSDENGNIVITDPDTDTPLTFDDLFTEYTTNYFVLKETSTPIGYHSTSEHHLEYDEETGVVFSRDHFETASYGIPRVTVSITGTIYKANENGIKGDDIYSFDNNNTLPVIHALVFTKNDNKEWVPITGNVEDGWKIWDNNEPDRIELAIQANGNTNDFIPTTNGMQVTIENLPGDVTEYYWYLNKSGNSTEAKYTIAYYYENNGNIVRIYDKELDRVFSTHVIVSNTKNYLAVEKVDEDGNPLNGVSFALYKKDKIKDAIGAGNKVDYEKLKDLESYDSGMTANLSRENGQKLNGKGLIVFPSEGKILEEGTYYLIETETLEGYIRNDIATKIIVGDDGVFADAGKIDDGIKTRVVVGSILKSMLRFVDDQGIDTTLSNIKVQLTKRDNNEWDDDASTVHLKYDNDRNGDEWGLEFDYQNNIEALVSDIGTNKLIIRQCTEHKNGEGNYTDLDDRDISNLYSTLTYVIYTNDKVDNTDGGNGTTDPEEPDYGDPDNGNGTQEPESPSTDNDPDDDRPINDHDELTCAEKYGDGYIWSDKYNACIPGAIVIVETSAR